MYIDVLVEIKSKSISKLFTYKTTKNVDVGYRVYVPFGKQKVEGFVLKKYDKKDIDYEVKDIIEVIDDHPVINEEMINLGKYISKKTLSSLISSYQTMLPSALKAKKNFKVNKKFLTYLEVNENPILKTEKQKEIYNYIKENKPLKKDANKISVYTVKTLLDKNYIKEVKKETYRINEKNEIEKNNLVLTKEQENVLKEVKLNEFKPYLLHGVTGSGKTLVYIKLIEQVLKQNKEAILLVPEISLTPQLVNIFKKEFGSIVAILHSGLNNGEKYDEWRKIEKKEVKIVIGARSAIFAPFTNLGIIIIDEEHSQTYKQENTPKYNAIDIALKRANTYNIPILLGSATPSIESYTRSKTNIYKLLELKSRVKNTMPEVKLINMKNEYKKGNRIFSQLLKEKINTSLKNNQQAIILLNRRGFSTVITCHECGFTHKCPNCDIPLTYHKKTNSMKCHYCNYTTYKYNTCPECKSKDINFFGLGTEKLEEEINKEFPLAKTIRMDNDTTRLKGAYKRIIDDFQNQKYNILIGTQMIAKGLDFPLVTTVGVISGDASLNIPDFRSAERTYQLLNQIAGRAGRDKLKGEVIIQGFNINHYSILLAAKHDYKNFYNEEMKIRKALKYPPYYNLCLIKVQGKNYDIVFEESKKIANYLKNNLKNNIVLGPTSATMPKINNIYYVNIIIKYKSTKEIYSKLEFINNNKKVNVDIDLNPYRI